MNQLLHGDCLELLPTLPDQFIDMILCDLPYGVTAAKWDSVLPMDRLWREYKRLVKPHGAIVLTAVQPFTSLLVTSNPRWYRHSWVWEKEKGTGFQCARFRPMQIHEDVLVFGRDSVAYSPQMTMRTKPLFGTGNRGKELYGTNMTRFPTRIYTHKYPMSILQFPRDPERIHPTQKPVRLFEYLIRTYTQPGQTVLDHCSGSGTTAIAALNTDRTYICIERDDEYYRKSAERIAHHIPQRSLFETEQTACAGHCGLSVRGVGDGW